MAARELEPCRPHGYSLHLHFSWIAFSTIVVETESMGFKEKVWKCKMDLECGQGVKGAVVS